MWMFPMDFGLVKEKQWILEIFLSNVLSPFMLTLENFVSQWMKGFKHTMLFQHPANVQLKRWTFKREGNNFPYKYTTFVHRPSDVQDV